MFPKVRTVSNLDKAAWTQATGLACLDVSRAVQSQKDEADINTIVKNFGITGKLPEAIRLPTYGDFDGIDNYRDAVHAIKQAEEAFAKVPAKLRAELNHDPGAFVEWCADPSTLEERRKLGLSDPAPVAPAADQPTA